WAAREAIPCSWSQWHGATKPRLPSSTGGTAGACSVLRYGCCPYANWRKRWFRTSSSSCGGVLSGSNRREVRCARSSWPSAMAELSTSSVPRALGDDVRRAPHTAPKLTTSSRTRSWISLSAKSFVRQWGHSAEPSARPSPSPTSAVTATSTSHRSSAFRKARPRAVFAPDWLVCASPSPKQGSIPSCPTRAAA
ncbi:MAG: RNA polymerase ECF-type sigma factor, partial [uncultured Acidimicrobiales bacterium]